MIRAMERPRLYGPTPFGSKTYNGFNGEAEFKQQKRSSTFNDSVNCFRIEDTLSHPPYQQAHDSKPVMLPPTAPHLPPLNFTLKETVVKDGLRQTALSQCQLVPKIKVTRRGIPTTLPSFNKSTIVKSLAKTLEDQGLFKDRHQKSTDNDDDVRVDGGVKATMHRQEKIADFYQPSNPTRHSFKEIEISKIFPPICTIGRENTTTNQGGQKLSTINNDLEEPAVTVRLDIRNPSNETLNECSAACSSASQHPVKPSCFDLTSDKSTPVESCLDFSKSIVLTGEKPEEIFLTHGLGDNFNSSFKVPARTDHAKFSIMVQETEIGRPCTKCDTNRCPGFSPHAWRNICYRCRCTRDWHDIAVGGAKNVLQSLKVNFQLTSRPAEQQINHQGSSSMLDNATTTVTAGEYCWVPPGLPSYKVEEYMNQLPNNKIPKFRSPGEKYRNRQLMAQLPRQDLSPAYCKHLYGFQERKAFEEFVEMRNEGALDIGYIIPKLDRKMECKKCHGLLDSHDLAVQAPKFGLDLVWHPACFSCDCCEELLVDLTYCIKDNGLYCERHYADLTKPRCAACDELIFAGEYTKAMNQDWHTGHFCCWQCDSSLSGHRYILRDDHPYCIKCYEDVFANTCDECGKPIGIDSKDLSYKEKHWHENCFLCTMCKISLVDKPFGSKNERIFCANCYDQAFATRCDGCGDIFRAGMKKMEYKGKQWHDKCFCCALCKNPIGTKSFIPKNEEVYCASCYEEKFATRCCKCRKVISSGGVTYKNEPWHKECFCCVHCNISLAGQRFTSKDDKPYCANCFGELFAKRCTACSKPIVGMGGSKFISFEDRHWHNDCFQCIQCKISLVGKGFITDAADILCPECAKARLMTQQG